MTNGAGYITNATLSGYALSSSVPTNNNQLANGAGYLTSVPAQTFASLLSKPTTLSGYGITDAYPLTGNPSGYINSITGSMVNTALGYTAYSASNPNGFISSVTSSLTFSIIFRAH